MGSAIDWIQRIKRERGVKYKAKNFEKPFRIAVQVELGNFSTYRAGLDGKSYIFSLSDILYSFWRAFKIPGHSSKLVREFLISVDNTVYQDEVDISQIGLSHYPINCLLLSVFPKCFSVFGNNQYPASIIPGFPFHLFPLFQSLFLDLDVSGQILCHINEKLEQRKFGL